MLLRTEYSLPRPEKIQFLRLLHCRSYRHSQRNHLLILIQIENPGRQKIRHRLQKSPRNRTRALLASVYSHSYTTLYEVRIPREQYLVVGVRVRIGHWWRRNLLRRKWSFFLMDVVFRHGLLLPLHFQSQGSQGFVWRRERVLRVVTQPAAIFIKLCTSKKKTPQTVRNQIIIFFKANQIIYYIFAL